MASTSTAISMRNNRNDDVPTAGASATISTPPGNDDRGGDDDDDDEDSFAPIPSFCERAIDLELPEGRCVGFRIRDDLLSSSVGDGDPDGLTPEAISSNPDHWIRSCLHPLEVEYGVSQPSVTGQRSFLLGRLAMRDVLGLLPPRQQQQRKQDGSARSSSSGVDDGCIILKDKYGRPNVPEGYLGSISHKRATVVAIGRRCSSIEGGGEEKDQRLLANGPSSSSSSSRRRPTLGIGIDVEEATSNRASIAKKVLTKHEIDNLGNVEVRRFV